MPDFTFTPVDHDPYADDQGPILERIPPKPMPQDVLPAYAAKAAESLAEPIRKTYYSATPMEAAQNATEAILGMAGPLPAKGAGVGLAAAVPFLARAARAAEPEVVGTVPKLVGPVYHGSSSPGIETFERMAGQATQKDTVNKMGTWFTSNAEDARNFGPHIYEANLGIQKPLHVEGWDGMHEVASAIGAINKDGQVSGEKFRKWLIKEGYDGVHMAGGEDNVAGLDYWVTLHPEQITHKPVVPGIRAFHGSPYDFEKFDISKIGTGEGAQAYGHGLYFAENPKVAQEYKENVTPSALTPPRRTFQGQELEPGSAQYHAGTLLETMGRTLAGVRKEVQGWIANAKPGEDVNHYRAVLETLNQAGSKRDFGVLPPQSLMYEASINADPEHFLHWDKPLSEQSQKVQQVLGGKVSSNEPLGSILGRAYNNPMHAGDILGKDRASREELTRGLADAGIPGIKYLDQGSRASDETNKILANYGSREKALEVAQKRLETANNSFNAASDRKYWGKVVNELQNPQTHNYVVFDDKLIDIIKKYGLAGLIAGGGGHFATTPVEGDPFKEPPHRQHGGRVNAANIDRAPTEAQKKAGNYAKDHVHIHGMDFTIENAKGHFRRGVDKGGKPWSVRMPAHYGYIKGTVGKDKDHVDIYLGPHPKSPRVFVVDQLNAETGKFDEHKAIIGFPSKLAAITCYHKGFSDGRSGERLGAITEMDIEHFKRWLEHGDTGKPVHQQVERAA